MPYKKENWSQYKGCTTCGAPSKKPCRDIRITKEGVPTQYIEHAHKGRPLL